MPKILARGTQKKAKGVGAFGEQTHDNNKVRRDFQKGARAGAMSSYDDPLKGALLQAEYVAKVDKLSGQAKTDAIYSNVLWKIGFAEGVAWNSEY